MDRTTLPAVPADRPHPPSRSPAPAGTDLLRPRNAGAPRPSEGRSPGGTGASGTQDAGETGWTGWTTAPARIGLSGRRRSGSRQSGGTRPWPVKHAAALLQAAPAEFEARETRLRHDRAVAEAARLEAALESTRAELTQARNAGTQAGLELQALRERIDTLTRELAAALDRITALQRRIDELEAELARATDPADAPALAADPWRAAQVLAAVTDPAHRAGLAAGLIQELDGPQAVEVFLTELLHRTGPEAIAPVLEEAMTAIPVPALAALLAPRPEGRGPATAQDPPAVPPADASATPGLGTRLGAGRVDGPYDAPSPGDDREHAGLATLATSATPPGPATEPADRLRDGIRDGLRDGLRDALRELLLLSAGRHLDAHALAAVAYLLTEQPHHGTVTRVLTEAAREDDRDVAEVSAALGALTGPRLRAAVAARTPGKTAALASHFLAAGRDHDALAVLRPDPGPAPA
ncbi:hypothetical protein [Streptomyces sp. NPDC086023]|uniref:hypothetical protein n=1 Tax=Streptomyces sp. NPDC086023 TaxID=3365746 RepID=UPI0037D95A6B